MREPCHKELAKRTITWGVTDGGKSKTSTEFENLNVMRI